MKTVLMVWETFGVNITEIFIMEGVWAEAAIISSGIYINTDDVEDCLPIYRIFQIITNYDEHGNHAGYPNGMKRIYGYPNALGPFTFDDIVICGVEPRGTPYAKVWKTV